MMLSAEYKQHAITLGRSAVPESSPYTSYQCIRRNGSVVPFSPEKISVAMTKAYLAVKGTSVQDSSSIRAKIRELTERVLHALVRSKPDGGAIHIEDIQDQVELALMRAEEHEVMRAYVLYREQRYRERLARGEALQNVVIHTVDLQGQRRILDIPALRDKLERISQELSLVSVDKILDDALKNLYDGVPLHEVSKSLILASRSLIEKEPAYNTMTARLLLDEVREEVWGTEYQSYQDSFHKLIHKGITAGLLDARLVEFDLETLATVLDPKRDMQFGYLGLQTLYDRYFLHIDGRRIEMPQAFFMRVAMGLALKEVERERYAIEFYHVLSSFDFMSSTPTLFNSGTCRSQLSSCYLTTVSDDLDGIYEAIKENALLSKFAGGLGNDWTAVRSMGSHIKGTNGKSQGVVPFLKVVNDTAVAVNQGGKRKGAVCAYLETWHADIEEFLELRKNTGDERRRTHDMNTANWIPDLFMKRVLEDKAWTLFSPSEVPDLHDLCGQAFEQRYKTYEDLANKGKMKTAKTISAVSLWRKILTMLFETGHPWVTFKDPCNIRSPQQHVGVVHSSNLCTEITLNTNDHEIAVCNLGSINLPNHVTSQGLDRAKLTKTVGLAMRMLDNVIDINFYPVVKARNANLKHRPVGLGMMGFQDCLHRMKIPYASEEAAEFADRSMEVLAYEAYWASTELAEERGRYSSFKGSLWDCGILPHESINLLATERGGYLDIDRSTTLDWEALRARIHQFGIRNSNCLAIAPTATIANIVGVSASIEPSFQNLFVKSNLSGEFTIVNEHLVEELKVRDLWDEVMLMDLKYYDGMLGPIDRVPDDLKSLYATAFEMDPTWLVECGARRQKWIDQSQSLNLYMANPSGRKMDELYRLAWIRGLKTTYYLRTLSASSAEKSTGRGGELTSVQATSGPIPVEASVSSEMQAAFCSIDNPDCESCQ